MKISGVTYVSRKRTPFRLIGKIALLLLIVLIAAVFLSGYNAWNVLTPEKSAPGLPRSGIKLDYNSVSFKPLNGDLTLKGVFFNAKKPRATLIMVHDLAKNRHQFSMDTYTLIQEIVDKNTNVFIFDTRACGSSEGKLVTFGVKEANDVLGAVRAAKARSKGDIILLGFGTGAASSLMAAAQGEKEAGYIGAVIADSPYSSLESYLEQTLPGEVALPLYPIVKLTSAVIKTAATGKLNPEGPGDILDKLSPKPVLFIQGRSDPSESARMLFNEYSSINLGMAHFWEAAGSSAENNYTASPSAYVNRISLFLDKVLGESK